MIAYSQFKMHNYSAAKATAEMGYSKKLIFAKSPHSDWERMYSAIIAISEHMSGNPLEAAEWDKKADITSLNTTTNDILLGVLVKRLEQHGNPLHILSGYAAMHENAFSMFKERQSSTLAKHLISYSHKQADMQKDKALTKDAINKENTFMFHSLLSPYLNCGLLDPKICIEKAEKKYYLDFKSIISQTAAESAIIVINKAEKRNV